MKSNQIHNKAILNSKQNNNSKNLTNTLDHTQTLSNFLINKFENI